MEEQAEETEKHRKRVEFGRCIVAIAVLLTAVGAIAQERQAPGRHPSAAVVTEESDSLAKVSRRRLCDSLEVRPPGQQLPVTIVSEKGDSLAEARNRRLYDSIEQKARRRKVPRMLYGLFFVSPSIDTTEVGAVVDQDRLFERYRGRIVSEVEIARIPVFDSGGNWFERTGNHIHVQTRERVLRRDLLVREGDTLEPQQLVRNLQLLRSRSYISDVDLEIVSNPRDTQFVKLILKARDSWSITADASLNSEGRTMVELSDDNIFGWGTRLAVRTHFHRPDFRYGGNIVRYEIPNIGGSFYRANLSAGRYFDESEFKFSLSKPFLQPTDYELGASYVRERRRYDTGIEDSVALMRIQAIDVWAGGARYLPSIRSSIFLAGHYSRSRYEQRPEVGPGLNPAFHESDLLLLTLGFYREKFYTANMIFGYGTREYVATGYQAFLTGGYDWSEFRNDIYFGTGFRTGRFTRAGYLFGGLALGSYISPLDGSWYRSVVNLDLKWFSNLYALRRSHLRQFLSLNYTQGWNRGQGYNEAIDFTDLDGIRTLREHFAATNRMTLNTETVLFSPFQPLGFRITFYGFADLGLIGTSPNPFKNEFYSSFGIGIRLRNERLIFSAIQLQLGIAVGKGGWSDCRWFQLTNQSRMEQYRYLPSRPEPVPFE